MKYLAIMRPSHWTKNLFVFAALVFGRKLEGSPTDVAVAVGSAMGAFVCFCLAASAVYIFNDIVDRGTDLMHPQKRNRPVAAGIVSLYQALTMAVICAATAVISATVLSQTLGIIILAYLSLMVLYSLVFKKIMILDCIVISVGFCLRAVAGAVAVGVFASPWLIICTFALCLFLGFTKRRAETGQLGAEGVDYRNTLAGYTPELLGHMLDVTSGLAVVCFLLYATDEKTISTFGTHNLIYTTPLVLYSVFRFSAMVQKAAYSGPVELVLGDRPFQIGLVLWVLSCMAIVYAEHLSGVFGNVWAY